MYSIYATRLGRFERQLRLFFTRIVEEYGRKDRVLRLYKPVKIDNSIYFPMKELHESLKNFEGMVQSQEDRVENHIRSKSLHGV